MASVWRDPLLPVIDIPTDLYSKATNKTWFQLGSAKYQLLPKQYEFLAAQEEFVGYVGGYGSGKTKVGAIKAAILSMHPGNRGLVGMETAKDLTEVAQRDLMEFLYEAELVEKAPTSKDNKVIIKCVDPLTNENLGYTAEVSFAHLDDPTHLRGRHLGWIWIDEGAKTKREAWQNLMGRLRLPTFRGRYKAIATGNPEGHNWMYDLWFNQEKLEGLVCKQPACRWCAKGDWAGCNRSQRLKRRGIHCSSRENYFLPDDYIPNMTATYSEEEIERYIDASFDVFEGQIYKSFKPETHVLPVANAAQYVTV